MILFSCKDYLDIKPYGKTIPQTAEEFSALLHKQLNEIDYGEPNIVGNIISSGNFECFCDNLETNLTNYPDGNRIPAYIGELLSQKQTVYSKLYESIRTANIIIGYMEDKDSDEAQNVLGTAYALRGVCYYQLLRQFCKPYDSKNPNQLGVPLVIEFNMEERPVRSSMQQTAELIENDFITAIKYNIQNEAFRFNNNIIKGYLTRLHFWMGQYEKVIPHAQELLKKYPLLEGDQYKAMINSNITRKGNILLKSGIFTNASTSLTYAAMMNSIKARPISRRFIELFEEGPKDIRYGISIGKKRVVTKKLLSCMRSAEFALILAESYYHLGKDEKALEVLNNLRKKRIYPYTDYTRTTLPNVNANDYIKQDAKGNALTPLIYAILAERRKEFFMESDRWFELKRNGCPEFWIAKQGLKYYTRNYMYTFPLPVKDIMLVEGLVQNLGYEKTK